MLENWRSCRVSAGIPRDDSRNIRVDGAESKEIYARIGLTHNVSALIARRLKTFHLRFVSLTVSLA